MTTNDNINDQYKPLKVLIAGGGIGGLSAAIFLRQAGHIVEIFEQSRFASETGAAIHIPSNVNGLLRRFGMIPEDHGANQTEWVSEYRPDGELVFSRDVRGLSKVYPYPWQLIHRVDLHNALKDIATSKKGKGMPAALHTRSRVASVDVETPSLTLDDGSTHTGDFIIAADGIHSKIRALLLKDLPPPESSGTNAFRFLIPIDEIRADPKTAHFVEKSGQLLLLYGKDRRIVAYPCRNNTLLNFVAMHPEEETEASSEEWSQSASKDTLLNCYTSYTDDVQALLAKVSPEDIKLWSLLDHEEMGRENWVHGKVALLGDAAHGFLPHQGQGGAQAIEDSAAIGALFPLGTRSSDIQQRLKLYVQARYDRATLVQDFTRQAAFETPRGKHGGKVIDPMQFMQTNLSHDAYDHAHGILIRYLNENALYRRMPMSFGPSPGPRQDLNGIKRNPLKATYKTSYITFKTYKSYLLTLLPSDDFQITTEGMWATATFSVTRLDNLEWLGGRGYSMLGFYVHDIVHKSSSDSHSGNSTELKGDFLPVLFENMADPIITGREELGFSKVFATLDEKASSESSFILSACWEGTEFCSLTLNDLEEAPDAESALCSPVLHYKAIPSSMKKGQDAEYATTYPSIPTAEGERRWKAGKAEIVFTDLENGELEMAFPTLANIIKGLRGVKVVEIIRSGIQASAS
ncbi:putative fad binding domain containing protein [Botrytis fragariae]|uniref:Putative fad binding domain containing protein n=1 Tax=Botrytis fragariae TaxID=1964551 RepID=A0A8H6ANE2_9HELO|nr:putative fad binding domain containing protein [Botrytis fragariae]KAF5870415.1 putative fad binding domain containing protein [Botrytis fragariae]